MYEYKKRQSKFKKFILIFLLIIVVAILSIFIYDMYTNIDVSTAQDKQSNQAIRLSNNEEVKTEEENITEILDKTIKCVVGISKIKNTGSSIFLNNSTSELGLRDRNDYLRKWIYTHKLACCG